MYKDYNERTKHIKTVYENLAEVNDIQHSNANRYEKCSVGMSWTGTRTEAELIDIVHNGWAKGVKKIEDNLSIIQLPRLANTRRRKTRGDFGDHLDIQAVYSGNLERAWEKAERQTSPSLNGNRVVIACDIGANSRRNSDKMFWKGAVASALADMLIASGRSVKIVGYFSANGVWQSGATKCDYTIVVKDYDESLMIDKIASVLSFAGFFRYYGFKMMYAEPWKTWESLGRHEDRVPAELKEDAGVELISISEIWSKESAQHFLNTIADKQNHGVAA